MARKKLTPAELVRERFGGYHAAARMLGYKSPVAVFHWVKRGKNKGHIPTNAQINVLETARRNNIPFTAEEVMRGGYEK